MQKHSIKIKWTTLAVCVDLDSVIAIKTNDMNIFRPFWHFAFESIFHLKCRALCSRHCNHETRKIHIPFIHLYFILLCSFVENLFCIQIVQTVDRVLTSSVIASFVLRWNCGKNSEILYRLYSKAGMPDIGIRYAMRFSSIVNAICILWDDTDAYNTNWTMWCNYINA